MMGINVEIMLGPQTAQGQNLPEVMSGLGQGSRR